MKEIVKFLSGSENCFVGQVLEKPGEKVRVVIVYYGKGQDDMRIMVRMDHFGPETESEVLVYGVLDGEAKKTLEMQTRLFPGCDGAKAVEKEEAMVLSDRVRNVTLPIMRCSEEGAHGEHGASSGRINPEQVRYLQTRGFSEMEARKMLMRAKLMQAAYRVQNPKKREWLREKISDIIET